MNETRKKILAIAPHPDDETLGCGGTLLRHRSQGDEIHWLIVTRMVKEIGYMREQMARREKEIAKVAKSFGFTSVVELGFPAAGLDRVAQAKLFSAIGGAIKEIQPQIVYLPHSGDVHSDHRAVFDAVISCTKSFRNPFIRRLLSYETLSETEFGLDPNGEAFRPNVFVDVSRFVAKKMEILRIYRSELGEFPFPRSEKAVNALMTLRGSTANCKAAEAFMLLKEISG